MKKKIDVQQYVRDVQGGDEKKLEELFLTTIVPFFHAYLKEKDIMQLKKDATQNLWEEYVIAINKYNFNSKMTFLSYIRFFFDKTITATFKQFKGYSTYVQNKETFKPIEIAQISDSNELVLSNKQYVQQLKEMLYKVIKKPKKVDIYFDYYIQELNVEEMIEKYGFCKTRMYQILFEVEIAAKKVGEKI